MTPDPTQRYESPTAVDLHRSDISAIADTVRRQVGYQPGGPLEEVVAKLGGELHHTDSWDIPGAILIEPGRFAVFLSRHVNREMGRFTVAHQLGHYVLHYLFQNQRNRRNIQYLQADHIGADQAEIEADWFAAGFLMPTALFRQQHAALAKDAFALAEHFGVTVQAVHARNESLNLRS